MQTPLNQIHSPTDEERHEMLMEALELDNRPEDYEFIIKYLSPPPDITNYAKPGGLKDKKKCIIGGGLAGLAAAFELRKLGANITILEASDNRIGGRVYTYYFDTEGNYYGEFGAARVPASHETSWHYINMFGLNMISLANTNNNNFLYVHNTRLRVTDSIEKYLYPLYPLTPQEKATSWIDLSHYAINYSFLALPPEIRSELIRILPFSSSEILPLMNMSTRQNFEKLGLSQGFIQLISGLRPSIGSFLHHSYDELAGLEYTLDNRLTYTMPGGFYLLPSAFYNSFSTEYPAAYHSIDKNLLGHVHMKLGHLVTGIYQSNYQNKIVIKYKNKTDTTEGAEIFDYCICAIPFSSLRAVEIKPRLSDTKMQAIMELNYADAQKTLFLCNRRFWERNTDYGRIIGGTSLTDLPIQTIIYPILRNENLYNWNSLSDEPGVLTASYSLGQDAARVAGRQEPNSYLLIKRCVEEVHGLPRGFLNTLVEENHTVHWDNESYFTGAFANCLPSQKPLFLYDMQRPEYNNRLFFAGEHVSSKHGWMQGSLYSGKAAANALAESVTTSNNYGYKT